MERNRGVCEVCGAGTEVITYDSSPADQRAALEAEIEEVRKMARAYLREMAEVGKAGSPPAREGWRQVCELCDPILNSAVAMLSQEIGDQDRIDAYSLLHRIANIFDDLGAIFEEPSDQKALEASIAEVREMAWAHLHEMASERESGSPDSHEGLKELLEVSDSVLDSALVILSQEINDPDRTMAHSLLQRIATVLDDLGVKFVEEIDGDEE